MTYLLKNPSGIIVEIDDLEQYKRSLRKSGFEPILGDSPEAKSYFNKRGVTTSKPNDPNHTRIQFVAPAPHTDGYGQSRGFLEDSLLEFGVHLEKDFNDQRIGIAYGYPEMVNKLQTPIKIIFTMFESTKIPAEWANDLKKADLIIVPSTFCQTAFKDAGFDSVVVPLGYDDSTFKYAEKDPSKEPFTFIHYDAFNQRKGWDLVFKAFNEEFRSESARLILKSTKLAGFPFPILKSQYPQINVIKEQVGQKELCDMLQGADCFVLPSRGEGFGIPPLEALATGTPVIIPNAHGFAEYFTRKYFFEVKVAGMTPALYERFKGVDTGQMVEPDVEDLRRQMRFVYEHRTYAFEQAAQGALWVSENWTYKQTAQRLASLLADFNRQKAKVEVKQAVKGEYQQSIIVLTYNALSYTKKCLNSIVKNTPANYELIIIDNKSTDDTQKWLKEFESKCEVPIKVIYNKTNKGVAGGRNQGLKIATGKVITFLDNDVEVKEGWQEAILKEFEDDQIGVVGKGGQMVPFLKPVKFLDPQKEDGKAFCDVVPGYCFSFRRELLGIVGNQFEGFPNGKFWHEDLEFCIRVSLAGYKILSNDHLPIIHYEHKSMGEDVDNNKSIKKVEGFFENAAFIQERMISTNILFIYRDWGGFDNPASYDRVCNKLSDSLRDLGMVVIRRPSVSTGCPSFNLCKGFDMIYNGKRIVWLHQENDRPPKAWQDDMLYVDGALGASPHILEACRHENYYKKLINVTPDGLDPEIYNTKVEPLDNFYPGKFKFLMVGATQPRKNTENLIKWYCDFFTKKDKVILIIKDFGYGHSKDTMRFLADIQKRKDAPEIAYIYEDWSSEYLAQVYKTVSLYGAYIHPHRAECFGLPQIEAVACGCRVGTTGWGGTKYNLEGLDTVTLFDYDLVDSSFHNHEGEPYYDKSEMPKWAEPKETDVKKFMLDMMKGKYNLEDAEKSSKVIIGRFSYKVRAREVKNALCKI